MVITVVKEMGTIFILLVVGSWGSKPSVHAEGPVSALVFLVTGCVPCLTILITAVSTSGFGQKVEESPDLDAGLRISKEPHLSLKPKLLLLLPTFSIVLF